MTDRHSIRFRLAATFAGFGALVSLLLSLGLSFAAHSLGERLMDETLRAETEDYVSRRARNPNSLPPATLSVRGYVQDTGRAAEEVPAELRGLPTGKHQLVLDGVLFRVTVTDRGDERYFMLFNEARQHQREEQFLFYLVGGALVMILISAGIGWWLAGRVVEPLAELARRVGNASPEDDRLDIDRGFADDEIGSLARVFGGYLRRMRDFIERERAFTSDVSHELRTPLAVAQGAVELLEADPRLDEKQQSRVSRIGRATRQMTELTTALLLMAREETQGEPVEQECAVWDIVRECVENHRYLVNENVLIKMQDLAHPCVAAERTLLAIVVANLIGNAFTYTKTGSISIRLENDCLTVSDTGPGIREAEIGRVFQRHFKGAGSTGAGIGLSLVKRVCDRYGWETVIESTEGQGTIAQLRFTPSPASSS